MKRFTVLIVQEAERWNASSPIYHLILSSPLTHQPIQSPFLNEAKETPSCTS